MLVIIAGLSGCRDKTQQPPAAPRAVRFVIAPAPSSSRVLTQSGEIRAHEEVSLGFRLDGRLVSRTAEVGDHVEAGQVLAIQESDTSRNQLNSARADLNSARAAEQVASLNLRRMKLLMPQGAIARTQLDSAQSDWQAAVSRRQSSEDALKNAQDNLAWSRLISPASGVITQVSASAGQMLSAGQSVVTLASGSGRDAVFDVTDPGAISRHADAPFTVTLLSEPQVSAQGHLRDISPQADPQTRTWRVRVTLDNPPAAMALGATVLGTFRLSGTQTIALPASALTRAGGEPALFIVDDASLRIHLRKVSIGRYTTDDVLITAGVTPGEKVVTAGVSKLRQGEKVVLGENRE
ncbi:efflux RND transporter periplasmic adaptor subunit [Rahnella sp. AA]|uniref:efflux RND transporter periplasmic adaptor subunit n=1 Tax=Rahnella sp. AA TaxID=2057180 RepID=UPI001E2899BC|nr:efflux RND transporter periplasmic adaptor subunit [Rahnella sp. AA]